MLTSHLKKSLANASYLNDFHEILDYAVFPPGKLFRPKLVQAVCHDLKCDSTECSLHLGAAIELHHAYSLVHDDLPCMDNDLMRRGKPSTHAAFGEWKAVLAGDALIIQSFRELSRINHPNFKIILNLFSWATGAKGLIAGQFLDLKTEKQKTLNQIIRIHELKTARLIEIATIGSYLLSSNKVELKKIISFMKLGRNIGVSFQFLDDLCELTDSKTSTHEEVINPFLSNPEESFSALMNYISEIKKIISKFELVSTSEMLRSYFHSIHQTIKNAEDQILVHIGNKSQRINLNRLMASLETF